MGTEQVDYGRWGPAYEPGMRGEVPPILVWKYSQAPPEIREAGNQGGDEDWVALVPAEMADKPIWWAQEGGWFGCCSVDEVELPDGGRLLVGCHA